MTPMIDVVFLLIIFFLVSSHLARQESQLPLPLPSADTGEAIADDGRARVVINLNQLGEMQLAGRMVTSEALLRRLRNEVERGDAELEVKIRSDRDVPFQFVQPILRAVSQAGVRHVTFAVVKK